MEAEERSGKGFKSDDTEVVFEGREGMVSLAGVVAFVMTFGEMVGCGVVIGETNGEMDGEADGMTEGMGVIGEITGGMDAG